MRKVDDSVTTLVIGASAAGLATAACLRRAGQDTTILEAESTVAPVWRRHYDRLHLHTPRSSSGLPGLAMPASWPRYPSRDQVVEYLEQYQRRHRLEPHFGRRVVEVVRTDPGWSVRTADRSFRARNVVVATGFARRPVRPTWPGLAGFRGRVLHSSGFGSGADFRGRKVLVVGFGNSACEQAIDLVEQGAQVRQSVRSGVNVLPRDVGGLVPVVTLGRYLRAFPSRVGDALAWPAVRLSVGDIRRLGLPKSELGPITQVIRRNQSPVLDIGTIALLRAGRLSVTGPIDHFTADSVVFADGSEWDPDAVVLGTGYRPALEEFLADWRAVCTPAGLVQSSGRPTALPGLFFCGQYVSPAGMLREIGLEARRIAAHLAG